MLLINSDALVLISPSSSTVEISNAPSPLKTTTPSCGLISITLPGIFPTYLRCL